MSTQTNQTKKTIIVYGFVRPISARLCEHTACVDIITLYLQFLAVQSYNKSGSVPSSIHHIILSELQHLVDTLYYWTDKHTVVMRHCFQNQEEEFYVTQTEIQIISQKISKIKNILPYISKMAKDVSNLLVHFENIQTKIKRNENKLDTMKQNNELQMRNLEKETNNISSYVKKFIRHQNDKNAQKLQGQKEQIITLQIELKHLKFKISNVATENNEQKRAINKYKVELELKKISHDNERELRLKFQNQSNNNNKLNKQLTMEKQQLNIEKQQLITAHKNFQIDIAIIACILFVVTLMETYIKNVMITKSDLGLVCLISFLSFLLTSALLTNRSFMFILLGGIVGTVGRVVLHPLILNE